MRKPVLPYANNNDPDQPAHPGSLISTFVVHCLDSIIPLVSISEISSLYLASGAAQAGLSLPWSQTPKTGFLMMWLILQRDVKKMTCHFTKECHIIDPECSNAYRDTSACCDDADQPAPLYRLIRVFRYLYEQTMAHWLLIEHPAKTAQYACMYKLTLVFIL